jgi:hypothetical protein
MKDLAKKLQPFIEGNPSIKIVEEEYSHDIIDRETGHVYGYVQMEEERFIGIEIEFEEGEEEPCPYTSTANTQKILDTAQSFVDTSVDRA